MVVSLEYDYLKDLAPKKRKALEKAASLEQLRLMVKAEMIPIVWALIDEAKNGNVKAANELFDRAFGKAKEHLEITGKFSLTALAEQWEERKKIREAEQALLEEQNPVKEVIKEIEEVEEVEEEIPNE